MPVLGPRGSAARRRAGSATHANMRVSDAERAEVADRLAQHYGDGRLDQAELDERLSRAMSAKTQADLDGLFDDLPDAAPGDRPAPPPPRPGRGPRAGRPRRRLLPIVLAILLVVVLWNGLHHWWFFPWGLFGFWFGGPWLWIALLAICWLAWGPWRHRR
jgi:Domain of unknown function (DUF1707)